MTTYRSVANVLLRYLGVYSLDSADNQNALNQRGLDDRDIPDVVACMNGALQEAYTLCPSNLIERQVGDVLRAPVNVTFTATQYSTTISGLTTYESWMLGCTIRVSGEDLDNRIVSQTELVRPLIGTSGSKTAVVYADCVPVPAAYVSIMEPVELPNYAPIKMTGDRNEFRWYNNPPIFGKHGRPLAGGYDTFNKSIGQPVLAMADWEAANVSTPGKLYLRFNPMPGQAYNVTYTGRLAPPTIAEADIWNGAGDPNTDPGSNIILPFPEAVLQAICLQRWTAHPSFSPEGQQLAEIGRQYKIARELLEKRPAQYIKGRVQFVA